MRDADQLVLILYLMLVVAYTILAFCKNKGNPQQTRNTLITFVMTLISPLVFIFSLLKLYVCFTVDSEGNKDE